MFQWVFVECLNVRNINSNEKSLFNLLLCMYSEIHFHSYLETSAPNAYGCNRDFFRIFGLKSSITLSVTFASIEQIWIPFPHFSVAALNISTRRQNKDPGSWILMVKYIGKKKRKKSCICWKVPYQPFWKIAKIALFCLCMKIKNFLGQMPLFEVLRKCHLVTLSKICLWFRPCAYLCG